MICQTFVQKLWCSTQKKAKKKGWEAHCANVVLFSRWLRTALYWKLDANCTSVRWRIDMKFWWNVLQGRRNVNKFVRTCLCGGHNLPQSSFPHTFRQPCDILLSLARALLTFYASNQMGGNKKRKQIGFYKRQRARQFVKVNRLLEKHRNPSNILL